eukprot:s1308_g3.t1
MGSNAVCCNDCAVSLHAFLAYYRLAYANTQARLRVRCDTRYCKMNHRATAPGRCRRRSFWPAVRVGASATNASCGRLVEASLALSRWPRGPGLSNPKITLDTMLTKMSSSGLERLTSLWLRLEQTGSSLLFVKLSIRLTSSSYSEECTVYKSKGHLPRESKERE